jgi:hypothetical protein
MRELPVIACSLSPTDLAERRARWAALTERWLLERALVPGGVRLAFHADDGTESELRALAALERECCGFASFRVTSSRGRVTLDVTAEGDGVAAVRGIFA